MPNPRSWWDNLTNKYTDFEELMAGAGGPENAGQQIDDLRTNPNSSFLPGLAREDRSEFDRYVHGVNFDRQNPGWRGAVTKAVTLPVATAYEMAKYYPPLLNAAAKVPGLETLAVDETTSPPSLGNVLAFNTGAFRSLGQAVNRLRQRQQRRIPSGE